MLQKHFLNCCIIKCNPFPLWIKFSTFDANIVSTLWTYFFQLFPWSRICHNSLQRTISDKNVEILISVRTVFGQLTIFSLIPMLRNHVKSSTRLSDSLFFLKIFILEYRYFTVPSKWYDCCNKMSQFFFRII